MKYKACLTHQNEFDALLPNILANLSTFQQNPLNILDLYNEELDKLRDTTTHSTFSASPPY